MASIPLTSQSVAYVKKKLLDEYYDIKSAHLSEALASALGRRTHAALIADIKLHEKDPPIEMLDDQAFDDRLTSLGYQSVDPGMDFSFDLYAYKSDGYIIETLDCYSRIDRYLTKREKAWRNLMVSGVNAAITHKLFSLRPGDDRWYDAENSSVLLDFEVFPNVPAKICISSAGFNELNISVGVKSDGRFLGAYNAGFYAGDAVATGWLERNLGAWLQSSPDLFNCRRYLLDTLANLEVKPKGFGDYGRVM